jgi:hypothetical protein
LPFKCDLQRYISAFLPEWFRRRREKSKFRKVREIGFGRFSGREHRVYDDRSSESRRRGGALQVESS